MPVTRGNSARPRLRAALGSLLIVACAVLAYEIPNRGIDPDELEHLHAAYCVFRGDVPYRDFFEHHGPALYYVLLPLFKWCGPSLSVLWLGRLAMWLCALTTVGFTGRLAGRWGGERAALMAMTLLAWTTVFQAKAVELRPDVPAALLLLLAVVEFTYATGGGSWRRFLCVGLLCGTATLFTQKSIVPAAGIAAASLLSRVLTRSDGPESRATIVARVIIPMGAGMVAVWGAAGILFAAAGAAADFWHSTWYQLWIWPVRSSRWEYLRPTLAGDFTLWSAAVVEMALVLKNFRAPDTWKNQHGAVAVIAALCILSLTVVKATYSQFFLLWMPFLAALAARRMAALADQPFTRLSRWSAFVAGLTLIFATAALAFRAHEQGDVGALPHLMRIDSGCLVIGALLTAALVALGFATRPLPKMNFAVAILAGLGMGYGALRNADRALWSNADQVAAIAAVNRQVPPDGRVLDGFTGYAALRPHVWYYWWINEYSLALVAETEREEGLLTRLENSPPAAVLYDEHLRRLPVAVCDWIERHYAPARPDVLWLPRPADSESN